MALCTVDNVLNYLGHSGSSEESYELITELTERVSTIIEDYCNRLFDVTEYTEYYDGTGGNTLVLSKGPVTTISGIWEDTAREWGSSTLIDSDDYYQKGDYIIVLKNTYFDYGSDTIKVIYSAGYETIPYSIVQVAVEETTRMFNERDRLGVSSKMTEFATFTYDISPLTKRSKMILDKYVVESIS